MKKHCATACLAVLLLAFGCLPDKQGGPTNVGPKIIETTGYKVPADSLADPIVIPLDESQLPRVIAGKPIITPLVNNVRTAGRPDTFGITTPRVCTPGQDGYAEPGTLSPRWRNMHVKEPEVVPAKDMVNKGDGPVSFGIFGKLQGMQRTVEQLLPDKEGDLWIGSQRGLSRFDGHNFSHYAFEHSPQNITCIFQDSFGRIWLGTNSLDKSGGICLYDGKTYACFTQALGFTDSNIYDMLEDGDGNIWIATGGSGLYKYDGELFTQFTEAQGLAHREVHSLCLDHRGNIWIGTGNGISKYSDDSGPHGSFTNYTSESGLACRTVHCLLEDDAGILWLATDSGVIQFAEVSEPTGDASFSRMTTSQGLPDNDVTDMIRDREGNLWFLIDKNSIVKYDGSTFTTFTEDHGLSTNLLSCIVQDQEGTIWVGTLSGLCKYFGNIFSHYTTRQGLSGNHIRTIYQDKAGDLWFGTESGGVNRFDGESFAHFGIAQGLPGKAVVSFCEDEEGSIWMGTISGVAKYEPAKDGQPESFAYINEAQGLPHRYALVVTRDRAGNMWFGTSGGAAKYDGKSLTIFAEAQGLAGRTINTILEDSAGNMWFGAVEEGVTRYDGRNFTHFTETEGFSHNTTEGITEDASGRIWFATGIGISQYDGNSITQISESQGLVSNLLRSVVLDRNGDLWFSTNIGLSHLSMSKWDNYLAHINSTTAHEMPHLFRHFSYEDGFLGVGGGTRSMFEANDGSLWVGTHDRLTVYHPPANFHDNPAPNIRLSGLRLFNEPFPWLEFTDQRDTSFRLKNGVEITAMRYDSLSNWQRLPAGLSLAHHNNNITFEFVGVTLSQPHKVRYQHKLEGLDDFWSSLTSTNSAQYGNLSPGDYTFIVKAMGNNGHWSDELAYPFTIRPPWWQTWWAYTSYAVLFILLLAAVRAYEIRRLTYRSEATRLKELDGMKSKLYTNITHEFRTPLTVIMGMVDNIKGFDQERGLIKRNSGKLLKLVNQMMDLSRFDSGAMKLNKKQADVIAYLNYLVESFYSIAQENEIRLTFYSEDPGLIMDFDEDKLQHVIYNLLSNAIKFTDAGGKIVLHARTHHDDTGPHLQIKVQDTGKGIPEESLPEIFDRFYQVEMSMTRTGEGSGIGLALAKEYVVLMGGTISVKSTLGVGSEFTVKLPITTEAPPADTGIAKENPPELATGTTNLPKDQPEEGSVDGLPILLIVEDNRDVVMYIRSIVNTNYQVLTAVNGKLGLEKAIETIPDVIISDVMMPEMDGYDLTQRLKNDERTSHIPVILLTAKAEQEARLTGLQLGADAYLAKPFDKAELLIRLEQLTTLRKALQRRYAQMQSPEEVEGRPTVEDAFLKKAREIVEQHLSESEFTVAQFSRVIGMSQTQLYRKLTALTARSPSQFIRLMRLQKASVMLRKTDLNVSEVAWETGFNDPNYFTRAFHQDFGMTPTEWRNQ